MKTVYKTIDRDNASIDNESACKCLKKYYGVILKYQDCDIYSADETDLFCQMLLQKT